MSRFAKENRAVHEFHLKKDASRWGVTDDTIENTFFVLHPPWVRLKPQLRSELHGTRPSMPFNEPWSADSGRVPFGPPTHT